LAAGVIFTVPAFVLAGAWEDVHLLEVTAIAIAGGTLGVLFTVPLRRAYIIEAKLPFPEGVACGEILKAGEEKGEGMRVLAGGIVLAALFNYGQLGMRLWTDTAQAATRFGNSVFYLGSSLAPILLGVGYIVGFRIASLIMMGGAIAWFILIPIFMTMRPFPVDAAGAQLSDIPAAFATWNANVRYVGGGAMITGGIYTIFKTRKSLKRAFDDGVTQFRQGKDAPRALRTERDIPMIQVLVGCLLLTIPIFGIYWFFTQSVAQAALAAIVMLVAGFLFSSVAGYLAGVVGSSNNPISGVTIVTLIFASFLLLATGATGAQGIQGALGVAAVIACAAAMAGDNLQDLKTGQIVGATPRTQQIALIVGVVVTAFIVGPVLNVIDAAYTIGSQQLPAPQAFLMSSIVQGLFAQTLDLNLLVMGMVLAVGLILLKLPVLPVAVGIYLPLTLSVPIFAGGILRLLVDRYLQSRYPVQSTVRAGEGVVHFTSSEATRNKRVHSSVERVGILLASGLIAGDAITGVVIAFMIVGGVSTTLFAPLIMVFLLAAGAVVVLRPGRLGQAIALVGGLVVGGGATYYLMTSGTSIAFTPTIFWPGLLIFIYIAIILIYIPVRDILLGRHLERGDGS
jgi:putative OPT family oligopeptide transporter